MSPSRSIRDGLLAATCALVGASAALPAEATDLDASLLFWSEGSRVTVNEVTFNLNKPLRGERTFDFNVVVDEMTGASHNGATRSNTVQTFTRPSGSGGYVIQAGRTPVDDTFQDNRFALAGAFGAPFGRHTRTSVGAHYSVEYDYQSLGGNTKWSRDFNRRNTTIALAAAVSWDQLTPQGGIPVPFASMTAPGAVPPRRDRLDDRMVTDVLLGLTQVLDRATLLRINYSLNYTSGYTTDPFKLLSVVDTAPGPTQGDPVDYVFERRPDTRLRHSVYGALKHHFTRDVIDISYRFMTDDWGVTSHTAEARHRLQFSGRRYLEPQYRFYTQTATDFYSVFLRNDASTPEYASADLRLAPFDAHTIALKVGKALGDTHEVNLRIGYYKQLGDRSPPEAVGNLRSLNLFPVVGATMIQVGYTARIN